MEIYPLNENEVSDLIKCNTPSGQWVPGWYDEIGCIGVDKSLFSDLRFSKHKEIFESFPKRDSVHINLHEMF